MGLLSCLHIFDLIKFYLLTIGNKINLNFEKFNYIISYHIVEDFYKIYL
jgi:hypothetical protein